MVNSSYMNPTEIHTSETGTTRQAAVTGLAVVGFIALVVLGIGLGVYSARFVPAVADRIGAAAVYLGSVFTPGSSNDDPGLSVVPSTTATTTLPFGNATTTEPATKPATKPVTGGTGTTAGQPTTTTYPTTVRVAPYGLADLTVTIISVGYLKSASPNDYVASDTVPEGMRPAVKFKVKNIGTNWTGTWRFEATIPTRSSYTFKSDVQQSIGPGDSIDYTLGFDQADDGSDRAVTITVNSDNSVNESNKNNNVATATLDID